MLFRKAPYDGQKSALLRYTFFVQRVGHSLSGVILSRRFSYRWVALGSVGAPSVFVVPSQSWNPCSREAESLLLLDDTVSEDHF